MLYFGYFPYIHIEMEKFFDQFRKSFKNKTTFLFNYFIRNNYTLYMKVI